MNTKICTSIKQSKKLMELGIDVNTADMHYVRKTFDWQGNPVDGKFSEPKYGNTSSKYAQYAVMNFTSYETLPAWSLSALLGLMPNDSIFRPMLYKGSHNNLWHGKENYYDNPLDAVFDMIIWLKENNKL